MNRKAFATVELCCGRDLLRRYVLAGFGQPTRGLGLPCPRRATTPVLCTVSLAVGRKKETASRPPNIRPRGTHRAPAQPAGSVDHRFCGPRFFGGYHSEQGVWLPPCRDYPGGASIMAVYSMCATKGMGTGVDETQVAKPTILTLGRHAGVLFEGTVIADSAAKDRRDVCATRAAENICTVQTAFGCK